MHFHNIYLCGSDGIPHGYGVVCIGARIQHYALHPAPALLNKGNQFAFMVGLKELYGDTQWIRCCSNLVVDALHAIATVDAYLPEAQHVQVGSVNNCNFSLHRYLPIINGLSSYMGNILVRRINVQFHQALISASKSKTLKLLHAIIFDKYLRYQMLILGYRGKLARDEHKQMMEAALARDEKKAIAVLEQHVTHWSGQFGS